ncbi:MAG TPA: TonB-dependent receptor [Vicinamibacterales bacterium]|nr:TonB-dependent receptor [Vicinamibacterales bacterium]
MSILPSVIRRCLSSLAFTALLSAPAFAQVDTGTITGIVKDQQGGVLPGATVTITHEGQALTLTTVTREDGTYIFTPIRTGAYRIEIEFPGFSKGVRQGVTVGIQEQVRVDFDLQPGAISEQVLVTAESPVLQTGSGSVGETLKSETIENLPVNGRDYTVLARLTTGVTPPQPGARAPLMFAANGVRPAQNNYLLDGIDNNTSNVDFLSGVAYVVKPPIDAVDEIKILTSSFNAEYGRAGGAVLNTTLKSGTNKLRGTVWEFHRNDALNANDYFAERAGVKKGEYLSNQFGVTAGGPVIASKTFWFFDYEGTPTKQSRTWVRSVPTALERASGFSNFSDLISLQSGTVGADVLGRSFPRGTIFDPATTRLLQAGQVDPLTGLVAVRTGYVRDNFAGNVIPAGRIDPNALKLMQLYPSPNQSGLNNNYVVNRTNTDDTHAFDTRIDHNFSGNDRLFVRYSFSNNHKVRPSPFEGDGDGGGFSEGDEKVRVNGFAASHTHMFSSTLINEARFGVGREHTFRLQPNGDDTSNLPAKYGILGIPQLDGNGGLPLLQIGNLSDLGHASWVVSERFSNTAQFSDNLTKVYKSHAFKGGYMYQYIFFGSTQPPYARGEYNWDGRYTSLVNQADNSTARAQMLLNQIPSNVAGGVDFLGGLTVLRASPFGSVDAFKTYHGAYGQDNWRVNSKLTVNYGLRWDWFSREQERQSEQANMVPGPPAQYLIPAEFQNKPLSPSFVSNLAKDGINLVYTDEFGSGLGPMPHNNLAPRLDAAYELTPKMVLRSGYGLFYGAFENRGGNPSLGYNYPFQYTLIYQAPNDTAPNRLPDGSLVGLDARDRVVLDPLAVNANGLTLRGVEYDYKTPRYHSYNVTLQTEVMPQHSVEVGYVGTRGRNLETFTGMNNVQVLLPPGTNPQPYVQWPDFARGSLLVRTVGVSSYDSLQLKFQRRYHAGLQFLASYTLSDSKTNAGDSLAGGGVGGLRGPDLVGWDLANDIGLSGFHTKHAFVFSGNYDLPGSGMWLGGWRTNWVLSLYSGQAQTIPCTVSTAAGTNTSGNGLGCYALVVGDPYSGKHDVDQFYNPAAFADPAPVKTIGQTDFSPLGGSRSQVTGPPLRQLDLGVARQFRIASDRQFEIRVEIFNVTNTAAFNLPGSLNYLDARNFASITSMRNVPRQVQLGVKLYW